MDLDSRGQEIIPLFPLKKKTKKEKAEEKKKPEESNF